MRKQTIKRQVYSVTAQNDCQVTATIDGTTYNLLDLKAGEQKTFVAIADEVEISDENAIVLPFVNAPATIGVNSGGGSEPMSDKWMCVANGEMSDVTAPSAGEHTYNGISFRLVYVSMYLNANYAFISNTGTFAKLIFNEPVSAEQVREVHAGISSAEYNSNTYHYTPLY